ncbi:HlyD family efflux transporter periplasmic adaptor subunit [Granulicoccus sp. GXG6511]|uniref:HlyD family efflux transporter periplasmic adaptor subunit n=1 Tax=Granulicoccus sp. GXG6511 TaxID=3381351 RepID=UPI003D7D5833
MTTANRLRLIGGLLAILFLCAALTLLYNQRQTRVSSVSATVNAPQTVVSSAYGGVVTDTFVKNGSEVRRGDRLFTVSSITLQQDLGHGVKPASTDAYEIDTSDGTVTYRAVQDGYVTDSQAEVGSFLANGAPMATVVADGQRQVIATYLMSPTDYGRVEDGSRVSIFLPNNERVDGHADGVAVSTEDGQAVTQVRVHSDDLADPRFAHLTRQGSPVVTVLELRDDGVLAGPTDAMMAFLTKIGLR